MTTPDTTETEAPPPAPAPASPPAPAPAHGPAIRAIREARALTISQVAESLGVSRSQVCNWESGARNPLPRHLFALAGLLGCPVAAITQPVNDK